jgi:hypothetical protein
MKTITQGGPWNFQIWWKAVSMCGKFIKNLYADVVVNPGCVVPPCRSVWNLWKDGNLLQVISWIISISCWVWSDISVRIKHCPFSLWSSTEASGWTAAANAFGNSYLRTHCNKIDADQRRTRICDRTKHILIQWVYLATLLKWPNLTLLA